MNIRAEKQRLREKIWNEMEAKGITLFPRPVHRRIPNFIGNEKAAENLRKLEIYKRARVIFVNPDAPQRKVRENALRDGKMVIMPVPRLKENFFLLLDPKKLKGKERERLVP